MKKVWLTLLLPGLLTVWSCEKQEINDGVHDIAEEAVNMEAAVLLKTTDYQKVEAEALFRDDDCEMYSRGILEFHEGDRVSARIDFNPKASDGNDCGGGNCDDDDSDSKDNYDGDQDRDNDQANDDNDEVRCEDGRGTRDVKFRHRANDRSAYLKVIAEPIVKTEDCDYPVEGVICFFDDNGWVATIDFGQGTCDDEATKTTADGTTTFSLKNFKKDKGGK